MIVVVSASLEVGHALLSISEIVVVSASLEVGPALHLCKA